MRQSQFWPACCTVTCARALRHGNSRLGKNRTEQGEGVFVSRSLTRTTPRETDLRYDELASGATVWAYQGNPFGEQQPTSSGYVLNLRFPGQYFDGESGMSNWGFRSYSAATSRSPQSDPAGLFGGQWSTYAYVDSSPLNFIDPYGLTLQRVTLPGLGSTYLDDAFSPHVDQFIANAAANGVDLNFNSAYRTPEHQAALHNDPHAITPADQSLHSCGFAVDVNYSTLSTAQQKIIRDAASSAGLSWGGSFSTPDPPHFYMNPPNDRSTAIQNATDEYQKLNSPTTQGGAP